MPVLFCQERLLCKLEPCPYKLIKIVVYEYAVENIISKYELNDLERFTKLGESYFYQLWLQ